MKSAAWGGKSNADTDFERADFEIFFKNGSYLIVASQFGVVARGADVNASLQEAVEKVKAVEGLYREAGVDPASRQGVAFSVPSVSWWKDTVPPALVSGIIMAGLLLLASVPLVSAATRFSSSVDGFSHAIVGSSADQLGRNAVDAVVRLGFAMDRVTPRRKEELRIAVRRIMNGLSPVFDEAVAACKSDAQPSLDAPHLIEK